MTRDEIIKLARETGFREPNPHDGFMGLAYDYRDGTDTGASLERFAAMVAAAEHKACLEIADLCADADMHASMAANAIRARSQA